MGVVYLGALVPLVIFAASGRWSPGRLVLWEIFVFTATIMVVMLVYTERFELDAALDLAVLAAVRIPAAELRRLPLATAGLARG